jgi:ubiquinol-cytochrome c reductase cytochrome b subunit
MTKYIAWVTQALFIVSLLSGLVVAFVYYPSLAYDSVQKLNYIIPFGSFFRQLHYFSSEAFLVSIFFHIVFELSKNNIRISFNSWAYSILGLLVAVLLMFTGFVLKADQSANAAAQVAFSLIKDTPFLDNLLSLFKDSTVFYWKFFVWHAIFLPLIITYVIYKHVKKLSVNIGYFTIALGISAFLSLLLCMPRDIALEEKVLHVKGPWFFWGAENLLQLGLSAISVNFVLLLPFIFLMLFYKKSNQKIVKILLLLWTIIYAYFSI